MSQTGFWASSDAWARLQFSLNQLKGVPHVAIRLAHAYTRRRY